MQFPASPYDVTHFEHDITSPITLMFLAFRETGHVPDVGGTLMLLAVGLGVLFGCRRLRIVRTKAAPHNTKALTSLNFLLLDAHRVFVRFNFAPRSIGIHLSKLSAEQQDL